MIEIIIFSIIFIFLLNFILFKLLNIDSIQNKIILVVISSVIIYYYLSRSELHLPLVQYKFVKYFLNWLSGVSVFTVKFSTSMGT